ncbi:MAG TPA: tagatose 1,6-diphosphate aldolase [Anaerolineaceae bacterium]|nr:tagatose 1,6-diphosphate aldolase [Anaerolineaceae bacterium]
MELSIGKRRGLAQCSNPYGVFSIMALDHRNNLRNAMNPGNPQAVNDAMMSAFKLEVVQALAPASSAVLLDPELGASQAVAAGALPGTTGLVVAVESTGYVGEPTGRESQVLPGWSVGKIKRMGASALKLLVYYHPDSDLAAEQENLVRTIAEACDRYDLPFFLEPLGYSIDPAVKKLSPDERRRVVIETARNLSPLGIDILKAEFPLDVKAQPDEGVWEEACRELTAASSVPWLLLSGGVDFDTFLAQVAAACKAGASGVMAGRAVWQEAVDLQGEARRDFLHGEGVVRMRRLEAVCTGLGVPWTRAYPPAETASEWYQGYPDF